MDTGYFKAVKEKLHTDVQNAAEKCCFWANKLCGIMFFNILHTHSYPIQDFRLF